MNKLQRLLQSKILILTVCAAGIGGTFQYGYNISIINAPASYIQTFMNETWLERTGVPLESNAILLLWSFTVSAYPLGGLAGAVVAGPMAITLGRKMSLLLNNVFVIIAAVLSGFSRMAKSFEMIMLSRFFTGVNAGVSMNIQPMYLAESAPKKLRGAVALTSASFTALGLVLGQVVGLRELLGGEESWPFLLASNVVPALIQLMALPWFPESPRYLLIDRGDKESCVSGPYLFCTKYVVPSKFVTALAAAPLISTLVVVRSMAAEMALAGSILLSNNGEGFALTFLQILQVGALHLAISVKSKRTEGKVQGIRGSIALAALQKLRGNTDLSVELEEMLAEQAAVKGQRAKNPWELFQNPALRWQLMSIVVLSSAMQLCGNDSMYFYAAYVFQEAGIPQDKIPYVVIGTGSCELIASITCNMVIDYAGRKPLLLGGYIFMAGWAIVFMVALSHQTQLSWMPYLSMACVFAYILSFGIGPAGVTGVLPTEVFDQMSRPAAYMICGSLLWFNLFLVGTTFPFIVKSLAHFCYFPFLVVCICTAFYVGFFLPETKGKSFLEISEEFKKRNFKAQTHAVFYKGPEEIKSTML